MASCSSEMDAPEAYGDGNVNLKITLPEPPGTRAFSNGMTARDLQVAVYDVSEATPVLADETTATFGENSLETTISLNLAVGRSYKIALFASLKENSPYTFSATEKNIKVDYSKMTEYNSSDKYDCFYRLYETGVVTDAINEEITLYRPVAQLNWGTSDLGAKVLMPVYGTSATDATLANLHTKVTTKAYTEFSLLDGDVTGTATEVTFPLAPRPAATEAYPYQPKAAEGETPAVKYEYLSMQYIFVPKASSLVDLKLMSAKSADADAPVLVTVDVPNAPVQANYRTNIFGALLTKPAEFTVVKEENYYKEDNNIPVWDGTAKAPKLEGNTYIITNPSELAWIAQQKKMVGNVNHFLSGKTIRLESDLDFNGKAWTPISSFTNESEVVFDGNGHTISNLTDMLFSSLIGDVKNLIIKNTNIVNAKKNYVGAVVGNLYGNVTDVTVENASIAANEDDIYKRFGGIVGIHNDGNATNCTVKNSNISGVYHNAGGISGTVNEINNRTYTNCVVENCNISIRCTSGSEAKMCGAISGNANGVTLNLVNCSQKNTTPEILVGTGNTTIDGQTEVDAAKYPGLYGSDLNLSVYSPAGFSSMIQYIADKAFANRLGGMTFTIKSDIDMKGVAVPSPWMQVGSNTDQAITIDGGNHVISNLNMPNGGMFHGAVAGSNDDILPCVVKNLTIDGAVVSGGYHVGVFGGNLATSWTFENVTVKNSKITGTCNVAAFVGSTGEMGRVLTTLSFKNCYAINNEIVANGGAEADPTGANVFVGRALNTATKKTALRFEGCDEKDNRVNTGSLAGGGIYGYTTYDGGWKNTGFSADFTNFN